MQQRNRLLIVTGFMITIAGFAIAIVAPGLYKVVGLLIAVCAAICLVFVVFIVNKQ